MNTMKTTTKTIKPTTKSKLQIILGNEGVERVNAFVYLGQTIREEGTSDSEIIIEIARGVYLHVRQAP